MTDYSLYTYTIPFDDGAAPNPFGGVCTLAICKPVIRRTAKIGDWVVAFGSTNRVGSDGKPLKGRLVYAMKVTEIFTLEEYNDIATERFPIKIPNHESTDLINRLGDCIYYDFKGGHPQQRKGVHNKDNMQTDLNGKNVLLSDHFYYFGSSAITLDPKLESLLHQTQGHKRQANDSLKQQFVDWLENKNLVVGQHGWPGMALEWESGVNHCSACFIRKKEGEKDEARAGAI